MKVVKKILVVIASVIIAMIVIGGILVVFDGDNYDTKTTNQTIDDSSASTSVSAQKEWVELIRLEGSGAKKSDVFNYAGGKARLRYDFKVGEYGGFLAIYVFKEGDNIMKEGGIPEVMVDGSEAGESSLNHLRKGNYYLDVSGVSGKWIVVVEEWR